jgi:SIR2-like domain
VPLVGSGLSQASGIASWDEIVRVVKKFTADSSSTVNEVDLDQFEAPDAFVGLTGSRQNLSSLLEEAVGRGFQPNPLHSLLAGIPFRTCLTTNWDSLLEDSLRASRRVNVIFDDRTARSWRESQAHQVIKLHGSIHAPDSIVFGGNDYARLYQQPSVLMSLVRTLIATRPILAIGFGMRDPFLKSLLRSVAGDQGREHFVVVSESHVDSTRRQYLDSFGLTVIRTQPSEGDPYGIGSFLKELRLRTYTEASTRVERTALLIRETERMQHYLGSEKVVRARASMGPLAVPETNELNVFGGNDIYEVENKLLDTVLQFVESKRGRLRLICCPLDGGDHAARKGYSIGAYNARLKAFAKRVRQMGPSVEVVTTTRPSDINDWIVGDLSLVESRKSLTKEGRLYEYARLETDPNVVSASIRRFDEEFDRLAAAAGGVDESRRRFLELASQETEDER